MNSAPLWHQYITAALFNGKFTLLYVRNLPGICEDIASSAVATSHPCQRWELRGEAAYLTQTRGALIGSPKQTTSGCRLSDCTLYPIVP